MDLALKPAYHLKFDQRTFCIPVLILTGREHGDRPATFFSRFYNKQMDVFGIHHHIIKTHLRVYTGIMTYGTPIFRYFAGTFSSLHGINSKFDECDLKTLIHGKPMIYYSLSIIMLAQIKEVAIISTPRDLPMYQANARRWLKEACHLQGTIKEPEGIAFYYLLAEAFLNGASSMLVLGDNILYGDGLGAKLHNYAASP